jgi:replicative DNA helicase
LYYLWHVLVIWNAGSLIFTRDGICTINNRLISSETGLSSKLRTGKLEKHEWEQLSTKVKKFRKRLCLLMIRHHYLFFLLRAKARRLVSQHGIQLCVDYLQCMEMVKEEGTGSRKSRQFLEFKGSCKGLNVPVIALSQLSRAVETRGSSKDLCFLTFVNQVR